MRYSLELGCSRSREPSRNPASHEASYDVCTLESSCNEALLCTAESAGAARQKDHCTAMPTPLWYARVGHGGGSMKLIGSLGRKAAVHNFTDSVPRHPRLSADRTLRVPLAIESLDLTDKAITNHVLPPLHRLLIHVHMYTIRRGSSRVECKPAGGRNKRRSGIATVR